MRIYIGSNIEYLCKVNNILLKDLGKILGKSSQAISHYVGGKSYPPVEILSDVCRYFNVTVDDLFFTNMAEEGITPRPKEIAAELDKCKKERDELFELVRAFRKARGADL